MTATITPPEWLTVGAKVAFVEYGFSGAPYVRFATVDRITPTTCVVNGKRYRLDDLAGMRPDNDPKVIRAVYENSLRGAVIYAEDALQKWRRAGFDAASTADARDALAALAPYLNPAKETAR